MDAALQDFLGSKPSMEIPKPDTQPADTKEQPEKASEVVQEKLSEAVPEQADGTPQVVRRISGKQRRASLEEYKETFSFRSVHRRPQARIRELRGKGQAGRVCPQARKPEDERFRTAGKYRPAAS